VAHVRNEIIYVDLQHGALVMIHGEEVGTIPWAGVKHTKHLSVLCPLRQQSENAKDENCMRHSRNK